MAGTAAFTVSRSNTILVTGASGFVGRHLAAALAAAGWTVRGASRQAVPAKVPGVDEWVCVPENATAEAWGAAVAGVTTVVHLAALAHHTDPRRQPTEEQFFEANAHATRRLAEAARAAGSVKRFVFLSSIGAVTDASDTPLDERTVPAPATPYGRSKLAGEAALAEVLGGSAVQFLSLRPVLIYGPGNPGNMARLLKLVRSGVPLPLGGVRNRRSFLFVENLVEAVLAALRTKSLPGGGFSVADREVVSTPELLRLIGAAAERPVQLWSAPRWLLNTAAAAGDVAAACGLRTGFDRYSLAKLEQSLEVSGDAFAQLTGWRPRIKLSEGLRRTLAPRRD